MKRLVLPGFAIIAAFVVAMMVVPPLLNLCCRGEGLYDLEAAQSANWSLPLFTSPTLEDDFGRLRTAYWYRDDGSQLMLRTYFIEDGSQPVAVAQLHSYTALSAGSFTGDHVRIDWAVDGEGTGCVPDQVSAEKWGLVTAPYVSCIYWDDSQRVQHFFYSMWLQDDAVRFVNALERVSDGTS